MEITNAKNKENKNNAPFMKKVDFYNEKTEYIGDIDSNGRYIVKLSSPKNPAKSWTLPIVGELLIGRSQSAAVCFDDKSVSQMQCKIIVRTSSPAVVHLGKTNKTVLNGVTVNGISPLKSGDTLQFGRCLLHIDHIRFDGVPSQPERKISSGNDNTTESVFLAAVN